MSTQILPDRLKRFLDKVHLRRGYGPGVIAGKVDVCLMQAVDWLTGGNGSTAHPPCVAGTLAKYCIVLNDSDLFAEYRDLLKPYAVRLVGTDTTLADEQKRAFIAADYAVRVFAPVWMRILGLSRLAERLAACAPIIDIASAESAREVARAAYEDAHAAAWAAYCSAPYPYAATAAFSHDAVCAASVAYSAASSADCAAISSDSVVSVAHYAVDCAVACAADAATSFAYDSHILRFAEHGGELRALSLECLDKMLAV